MAYWGIATLRAVENFPISGRTVGSLRDLVWSYGAVKAAAARSNAALGLLRPEVAEAIERACQDMMDGVLDDELVVDRIQSGAGTSTNMNVNEVLANSALTHLGQPMGDYTTVHPVGPRQPLPKHE